jgi:hypothetical protein
LVLKIQVRNLRKWKVLTLRNKWRKAIHKILLKIKSINSNLLIPLKTKINNQNYGSKTSGKKPSRIEGFNLKKKWRKAINKIPLEIKGIL